MANNIVQMIAPAGNLAAVSCNVATPPSSGQTYVPDVNGRVLVDPLDVSLMLRAGYKLGFALTSGKVATADNGTTQTLTPAMVTGGGEVFHTSTGGSTPTLTLPLAADVIALAGLAVGQSYLLRVINSNSGTATIASNTGWSLTGTLTLATNTWREFVVTMNGAGTLTAVNVGTGSNS